MAGPYLELVGDLIVYGMMGKYGVDVVAIVNDRGEDIDVAEVIAVAFQAVRDGHGNYALGRVRLVIEAVDADTKGVTTWQSNPSVPA